MIVKTESDEVEKYLTDESNFKGSCEAVYFPENETELAGLLRKFNESGTKVTISGNGTGLTSGRVPDGGIVITTEKLNRILLLNEEEHYIIVEPAVILQDLQTYVEEKNLFYPPDPTERNCFIGATAATNASGARTFKYGPTRDYILALRIALPDGEIISLERGTSFASGTDAKLTTESGREILFDIPRFDMPLSSKNAAGYFCEKNMDLIDLFIGSEGTLGVITELKLKLLDLPKDLFSCVAFFPGEENALDFIEEARTRSKSKSGTDLIDARGLEYFDKYALRFLAKDFPNIPGTAKGAVWYEQEVKGNEDETLFQWTGLMEKHKSPEEESWFALDRNEQEKFKEFRHAIAWKVNEFIAQRGLKKIGTDVAVPDSAFRSYYFKITERIEHAGLRYVVYGHAGNSHIHLNFLPSDNDEYNRSRELYKEICMEAINLHGTFSAEHGVGKTKRDFLLMMYGVEIIKKMASLKRVFDPRKILNIGNIFEAEYLES
jgi:D-lactate dehydrogenase (cytochrome)